MNELQEINAYLHKPIIFLTYKIIISLKKRLKLFKHVLELTSKSKLDNVFHSLAFDPDQNQEE